MRYHYKIPADTRQIAGETYECPNSSIYKRGTLFKEGEAGLVLIQQRYNPNTKVTWWTEIDPWIASDLYLSDDFENMFKLYASPARNDIYPALTVRQAMYMCHMKPLEKQSWETTFTGKPI